MNKKISPDLDKENKRRIRIQKTKDLNRATAIFNARILAFLAKTDDEKRQKMKIKKLNPHQRIMQNLREKYPKTFARIVPMYKALERTGTPKFWPKT